MYQNDSEIHSLQIHLHFIAAAANSELIGVSSASSTHFSTHEFCGCTQTGKVFIFDSVVSRNRRWHSVFPHPIQAHSGCQDRGKKKSKKKKLWQGSVWGDGKLDRSESGFKGSRGKNWQPNKPFNGRKSGLFVSKELVSRLHGIYHELFRLMLKYHSCITCIIKKNLWCYWFLVILSFVSTKVYDNCFSRRKQTTEFWLFMRLMYSWSQEIIWNNLDVMDQ